eukprot:scaffold37537_cov18-Tisochrysis_lutea.AAC.3
MRAAVELPLIPNHCQKGCLSCYKQAHHYQTSLSTCTDDLMLRSALDTLWPPTPTKSAYAALTGSLLPNHSRHSLQPNH